MSEKYILKNGLNRMPIDFFMNNNEMSLNEKKAIMAHFEKGKRIVYAFVPSVDMVTGEKISEKNDDLYSDGVYSWNYSLPYHFEKYNIELDREFIDYVLGLVAR